MANPDPDPYKVIIYNIEKLDSEMNSHPKSCLNCINKKKCEAWHDMVEAWNFYYLGMIRAETEVLLPPEYQQ